MLGLKYLGGRVFEGGRRWVVGGRRGVCAQVRLLVRRLGAGGGRRGLV